MTLVLALAAFQVQTSTLVITLAFQNTKQGHEMRQANCTKTKFTMIVLRVPVEE